MPLDRERQPKNSGHGPAAETGEKQHHERSRLGSAPDSGADKKMQLRYPEVAEKLHEKCIHVTPPTLAKYLNEFRRGKDRKTAPPPPPAKTALAPQPDRPARVSSGQFVVTPDIPLDEL